MSLDLLQSKNLSFLTVPLAFGLCYLPHLYAVHLLGLPNYDISNPRSFRETMARNTAISKTVRCPLSFCPPRTRAQRCQPAEASCSGRGIIRAQRGQPAAGDPR
ncbi:hypothetical protein AAL_06167 [Moelleriella libera RCEF 2490]|uniref:Uncharacterized protein n=1 Tax=Moelleriella libera RCEF 2490 TaxID=1081109 RepID=A0A167ZE67_9HYPO|nr:hypothetical protein AAL_06167 [Moelleriella libera RCEF 2490]